MKPLNKYAVDQRLAPVRTEFQNGRRELVGSPGYEDFRRLLIRSPLKAVAMLRSSPECVLYAACMMSNIETSDACHEAADTLVKVAKEGVPVGHAMHVVAGVMITDEFFSIRAKAAEIAAIHAESGGDISQIAQALEAALGDSNSEVRANAKRALQAGNLIS